ncbi:hypothetical protein BDF20DRAFT_997573 [Mycotypha africana]|uniref:uncharacterized protein n=1 Tax=Mycotypha africana TaxID=64632 RepID=UPI00230091CC|nr:uncharacterized protein BDF20DRAFT_997573 [Mycotypha africana]KAI8991771.1 hypothetical protein BDF20DRAFT_997573 [Mycotypha africana]
MRIRNNYRDEPIPASSVKLIQWFGLDNFEPERAVTSHFISSRTLFYIRLPLTLYTLIVMWADIVYTAQTGGIRHFLAYFTDLTFIGLHSYQMATLYHHARYIWSAKNQPSLPKTPTTFINQHSSLNYLYYYLYHTVVVFNLLTPFVFWTLLAKEKLIDAHLSEIDFWTSISLHAVTLFIIILEVLFNRMSLSIRAVLLVYGTVLIYMCLTFIIYATEKWWVYSFLDWNVGPTAIIWYLAISILVILFFFTQLGMHKLRDWAAKKIVTVTNAKKRSSQHPQRRSLRPSCQISPSISNGEKTLHTPDDEIENENKMNDTTYNYSERKKQNKIDQEYSVALSDNDSQTMIQQSSNFEPLASTICGKSTFGDTCTENLSTNASSIYYYS